jgi:2-C-methyl-D-erythritol 4-phosphate cytidylyltransferase
MKHIAILLAGGKGTRMNAAGMDKLLMPIKNINAFQLSYRAFLESSIIDNAVVVYRETQQKGLLIEQIELAHTNLNRAFEPILVRGGIERKDSVANALANCPKTCKFVYVHDCARPMIQAKTITKLGTIVQETGAVVIAKPVHDTLKETQNHNAAKPLSPCHTKSVDRSKLWIMETPQVSRKDWLDRGMKLVKKEKLLTTDEVSVLQLIGKKVSLFNPNYPNPKITSSADWSYIEFLLSQ